MMASDGQDVAFREVQWMRRVVWVMVLILGITVLSWYSFIQQIILGRPFGSQPGPDWSVWLLWAVFGLVFPAMFYIMRLVVEVRADHVYIRYYPIMRRRIPLAQIDHVEARRYNPIGEYGGWGIKGWWLGRISYTVSGTRGVELTLRNGRRVMIGSRRADELATAIESRL